MSEPAQPLLPPFMLRGSHAHGFWLEGEREREIINLLLIVAAAVAAVATVIEAMTHAKFAATSPATSLSPSSSPHPPLPLGSPCGTSKSICLESNLFS